MISFDKYKARNIKIVFILWSVNERFFNKSTTSFFLNKTKTALDINKILYSCKITFDVIMNETRFLLHGHHGHACRSPDAEPNF